MRISGNNTATVWLVRERLVLWKWKTGIGLNPTMDPVGHTTLVGVPAQCLTTVIGIHTASNWKTERMAHGAGACAGTTEMDEWVSLNVYFHLN